MKIKVCGMRDPENMLDLAELKPDYMGLIFYPKSTRYVPHPDKTTLASLPGSICLTGVFVDAELELIIQKVMDYGLGALQLHGKESPEYCLQLKRKLRKLLPDRFVELIKAFGVDASFDFSICESYDEGVEYFLFDTKTPAYGGSGISFDWKILDYYHGEKQYFLSGGLSPENIKDLLNLETKKIYAVDLNSRFEILPGIKNMESLSSAFQILRAERIS